ncbi:MAG: efflux RND transporter permease subunit [Bacteroidetes bacterium]|nr:efflux RND transporter permease subunit [Bacteroidota bacterium]
MKIVDLAIRYRPTVAILTIMLSLGGLVSYLTISKEAFPSIEIPTVVVTTIYPGASPSDIESLVTRIIEEEIQSVSDIEEIRSTSVRGVSTIMVEFTTGVSLDFAYQRVRDKVQIAKARLPSDIEEPIVAEFDVEDIPIMSVNLAGAYSVSKLKDIAEELGDELEKIPNILEVELIGALDREVKVDVDIRALQGYDLTFSDLIETINSENSNTPGGTIRVDSRDYIVRIDGEFRDIREEIEGLVLKNPNGYPVYVRDVADVYLGYKERSTYSRLQLLQEEEGKQLFRLAETASYPVITLNVKKRSGANILDTADEIRDVLDAFPLPTGAQIAITGDQSETVQLLVDDLENNIISGLIFVVLVLLFFLGFRTAVLVGIAIPLSMFLTFLVFQLIGQELNFIILFSLIIALGMLVDNAVVIVENIYRFRELGYSRFEAAKLGTAEVGSAVVASTATTVAVFIPMLFWPGITGEFMGYLPLTLIITLTCSLFVAIVINPVITGYFVRLDTEYFVRLDSRPKMRYSLAVRSILAVLLGVVALIIGLSNWKSLLVLSIALPILIAAHKFVFSPVTHRFVGQALPNLIRWYRSFLHNQLQSNYEFDVSIFHKTWLWISAGILYAIGLSLILYDAFAGFTQLSFIYGLIGFAVVILIVTATIRTPNPILRNSLWFISLTLGVGLAIIGGVIAGLANIPAAITLFYPAGILFLLGILLVVIHCVETIYLSGMASIKAGIVFAIFSSAFLGLMALVRGAEFQVIFILLSLPALIIAIGALGHLLNGGVFQQRTHLLLTDNRSRLMVSVAGGFIAIITLFSVAPTGVEFFPDTDPNIITVDLELPLGTHLDETNNITEIAQSRINSLIESNQSDQGNIKNVLVNVGTSSSGGDLMGGGPGSPESSVVTLNVVRYGNRSETSRNTLLRLRESLQGIPGVIFEINKDNAGPPVGKPVNIEITGRDFSEITRITKEITDILTRSSLDNTIPQLVDINNNLNTGRPQIQVHIDRERAARIGLDSREVSSVIRSAIQGSEATKYRSGEDEYDVIVRLKENQRASLETLDALTVIHDGTQIPLSSIADFEISGGYGSITRLDLNRVATVTGDVIPGANGAAVLQQVQNHLSEYQNSMPLGYQMTYTGESEDQAEAFGFLQVAMAIGIAAITIILIAQFNSIIAPIIIMLAVILGLIGVLLGLILTRTPFGLMTFIGLISLAGIVVNNNIVLIDYIRQLRDRGKTKLDAIIDGGATRLRPVLLTFLTTVIGLVPLTFGLNVDFVGLLSNLTPNFEFGSQNTQFWGPMGIAIISGLTFATFLTLVIVPVMYSALDSLACYMTSAKKSDVAEPDP